jgi:DNA-binding transcriptional ArsR family regulator
MPDHSLSSAHRVASPPAAAAFANPLRRRLILMLAQQERSAGDLAAATGMDLKRLHYHLGALVRLGLVVVTRHRPRAGRPVKLYGAVAQCFFVPAEAAPATPDHPLADELRAALATHAGAAQRGTLYQCTEAGAFLIRPIASDPPPPLPASEAWRVLALSAAQARRLATELDACLKAAARRSQGQGEGQGQGALRSYLAHIALAPRAKA